MNPQINSHKDTNYAELLQDLTGHFNMSYSKDQWARFEVYFSNFRKMGDNRGSTTQPYLPYFGGRTSVNGMFSLNVGLFFFVGVTFCLGSDPCLFFAGMFSVSKQNLPTVLKMLFSQSDVFAFFGAKISSNVTRFFQERASFSRNVHHSFQ